MQQTDRSLGGVGVVADSLALNGGKIAAVSDGGAAVLVHTALAVDEARTVNGGNSLPPVTGGICARTPAVAAAIMERVRAAKGNNSLTCDDIDEQTDLLAITGRLDLSAQVSAHGRMTALKAGDFADLTKVTALDLDNHALRSFPAGIFGPLTALTELSIAYNQTQAGDRLTTLPAGLFAGLTNLTTLRLEHNDLETLPAGVFEPLTGLTALHLHGNNLSSLPDRIFQPLEKPHDSDVPRQSRQRDVPARSGGRSGGRDRRESRGGGGVAGRGCWRSLGQQPGLFVGQGHGNDGRPVGDGCIQMPTLTAPALAEASDAGVRTDGDRAGHEPDRDGQRDRAGRGGGGGGGGVVRRPGLDAGRRERHLQERRED